MEMTTSTRVTRSEPQGGVRFVMDEKQELRIPGPAPVPPGVLRAGARPMINHRGPEFKAILQRVVEGMQALFATQGDVVMLTGSGTAGMEAACANLVGPGDRVMVLQGGFFGRRWADLARAFGAQVEVYEYPWHTGADPSEVGRRLRELGDVRVVFATHNESSTGVLNDVQAISAARQQAAPEALLVVDSVSGLGGAPLPMDEWGVDVVVTASQKCLMAPPGLAFVAASPRAWERMSQVKSARYYLDLRAHRDMLRKGQTPWTPAVSVVFAMDEALRLLAQEPAPQRFARHRLMRDMVRAGLEGAGLELFVEPRWASPTVTAARPPAGVDADGLRRIALDELGVVLSGGQGPLSGQLVRVGHMGYATPLEMLTAVAAVEVALARAGHPVTLGRGVARAQEVYLQWM